MPNVEIHQRGKFSNAVHSTTRQLQPLELSLQAWPYQKNNVPCNDNFNNEVKIATTNQQQKLNHTGCIPPKTTSSPIQSPRRQNPIFPS
jgi:hypothetical protein